MLYSCHRVRLIDNSDDSSESTTKGPEMLYDSALDPVWPAPDHQPLKEVRDADRAGWVDAKGFVEGRLIQGEDGRVRERREEKARSPGKEGGKL